MGYTHYWYRKAGSPVSIQLLMDMAEVIRRSPVPLAAADGTPGTEPEVSEGGVVFNGLGDLAHEPFEFLVVAQRQPWESEAEPWAFRFCKTERKPYDAVVVACLLAAKHHLGEHIRISSDGHWADWRQGADLYEAVFPARAPVECPFEQERQK